MIEALRCLSTKLKYLLERTFRFARRQTLGKKIIFISSSEGYQFQNKCHLFLGWDRLLVPVVGLDFKKGKHQTA